MTPSPDKPIAGVSLDPAKMVRELKRIKAKVGAQKDNFVAPIFDAMLAMLIDAVKNSTVPTPNTRSEEDG